MKKLGRPKLKASEHRIQWTVTVSQNTAHAIEKLAISENLSRGQALDRIVKEWR